MFLKKYFRPFAASTDRETKLILDLADQAANTGDSLRQRTQAKGEGGDPSTT